MGWISRGKSGIHLRKMTSRNRRRQKHLVLFEFDLRLSS